MAIEVLAADDVKAATSEAMKVFLRDSEVKIDESSMQPKQVHFGSTKATDTTFDGSNEDGPQNFAMTWLPLPKAVTPPDDVKHVDIGESDARGLAPLPAKVGTAGSKAKPRHRIL